MEKTKLNTIRNAFWDSLDTTPPPADVFLEPEAELHEPEDRELDEAKDEPKEDEPKEDESPAGDVPVELPYIDLPPRMSRSDFAAGSRTSGGGSDGSEEEEGDVPPPRSLSYEHPEGPDLLSSLSSPSLPSLGPVAISTSPPAVLSTSATSLPQVRKKSPLLRSKVGSAVSQERGKKRLSGKVRVRSSTERGKEAFPGMALKMVCDCVACGKSSDSQTYLKCSSCKRDTCAGCTVLRVLDGKQRLACAGCAAKAQREAALKAKPGSALLKGPQGLFAFSLTALCAAEGSGESGPRLFEFLTGEIVARGGEKAEGLFRLSVSGQTLADAAAHLQTCQPGNYSLPGFDVHCVGALFKQWLRDLPEPVLSDYLSALPPWPPLSDPDAGRSFDASLFDSPDHYVALLRRVPAANARLLIRLGKFLIRMAAEPVAARTKMGVDNLCTVFSQCIMRNPSQDPFSLLKNQPREHKFLFSFLRLLAEIEAQLQINV